jgi:hydroxyacylglutathione hydrolase
MFLEKVVCGRAHSNAYVFAPPGSNQALVIDAGSGAAARISDIVRSEGLEPQALLLTHGHPDHIWTARQLTDAFEIPAYIHSGDVRWLSDPMTGGNLPGVRLVGRVLGQARSMRPRRLHTISDSEVIEAGELRVSVSHTPGHSKGSVCLRTGDLCFAGDTVFAGNVGRPIFPGGDAHALRESLRTKLLGFPDDLRLFPGHGEATTVGAERGGWKRYVGEG